MKPSDHIQFKSLAIDADKRLVVLSVHNKTDDIVEGYTFGFDTLIKKLIDTLYLDEFVRDKIQNDVFDNPLNLVR